jgi:hypothetical protein
MIGNCHDSPEKFQHLASIYRLIRVFFSKALVGRNGIGAKTNRL